jgi:hypothetical protein
MASNKDLDGDKVGNRESRTHLLTAALIEAKDEKSLWFDYGIVSGVMVCV